MIVCSSNGTIVKSKLSNHCPTFKGVERTTLVVDFIAEFTTLNVVLLLPGLQWSDVAICSLTKMWVALVSTKATTFHLLIVAFTKQSSCIPSSCNSCSWPPVTNSPRPTVKAYSKSQDHAAEKALYTKGTGTLRTVIWSEWHPSPLCHLKLKK